MNSGVALHLAQVPYLGLRPFEVDEADIFFGRERQTDELLRRLSQTYFLPIVGPSGCGKSSLVRAGLLASLESGFIVEAGGRWRILTMMPRDRPIEELANAILGRLSDPDESKLIALQAALRSGPRGLIEALKEIPIAPGENLLLLVDQFEEIFRFRDQLASRVLAEGAGPQDQKRKDEADAFVALLLETVKDKAAYVVLTMRSDFLRDCSLFSGLPEAFNKSIYLTPRLDRDDLQSAIQEPARVLGGSLQPDLVRQLINDARSNQDQLPMMQHVLMRMWSDVLLKRPDTPPELTLEDYVGVGALSKALCQDADAAFEKELTPEQQRIAEVMFKALCVRGSSDRDTRAPARLDHVAKVANVKWEEIVPVVVVFRGAGRYFLSPRSGPLASDTVLDITHESLIRNWKRLSQWVEDEALSAETYQRLIRDALDWKGGGDLLSPIRLSSLNAWEKRFNPTEPWSQRYGGQFALATEYLQASRTQREKEAQEAAMAQQKLYLRGKAIKVLGFALGLAVLISAFALYQTVRANRATRRANEETRRANAQTILAGQETAAARTSYGSALAYRALAEWRSQKPLSAWPFAVEFPRYNKGLTLVSDLAEPRIRYYRQIHHKSKVSALAISPDGKTLGVALDDGSIDLVDPQAGSVLRTLAALPSETKAGAKPSAWEVSGRKGEADLLAFSPDGKLLYFLRRESGLEVRSLPDGALQPLPEISPSLPAPEMIASFAIDSSGAFALGLRDGTLVFYRNGSVPLTTQTSAKADSPVQTTRKMPRKNPEDPASEPREISDLTFSLDGKTIAGISRDQKLRVWQIDNTEIREVRLKKWKEEIDFELEPNLRLGNLVFSPMENDLLMLVYEEGKIDLARLSRDGGSRPNQGPPTPTRESIVTGDKKTQMRVLPSTSEQPAPPPEHSAEIALGVASIASFTPPESSEIELPTISRPTPIEESPKISGNVMAAIDPSGEIFYWVTGTGRLNAWWPDEVDLGTKAADDGTSQLFVRAHDNGATAIVISPSGSWLATGGGDRTTRLWKIKTLEAPARASLPPILTMASDSSGTIVAIGSEDSEMRVFRDNTLQPIPDLKPGHTPDMLYLSPDARSLVVTFEQTKLILDVPAFSIRTQIEGVSYSPYGFNGPILAGIREPGEPLEVTLWDASTAKPLGRIPAAKKEIVDIMFGSTGRDFVAIATDDNRIGIWNIRDPAQPREVRTMNTGESAINFISFAPAENLIAAATLDKVIVFDAKTAALVAEIPVSEPPNVIAFNAPGTLLALGFATEVKIWDCPDFRERASIREAAGFASTIAITANTEIVTAGEDRRVRFWNVDGQLIRTLPSQDWQPKTPDQAALLSGLKLEPKDLVVRFLTREEEEKLQIDASAPLDKEGLGEYWRALRATIRDFETLGKTPDVSLEAIQNADQLGRWLSTHEESSDIGTRKRVEIARERHKSLRSTLAERREFQAEVYYQSKNYDQALAAVNQALTLVSGPAAASNPANKKLSASLASLLLLRGRTLMALNSPEAEKDFRQIIDGKLTGGVGSGITALAQLHLASLNPENLVAAEDYFRRQLKSYSARSLFHYYLACVLAIRSASPGIDNDARAKDATAAIEILKNGLRRGNYSLRRFVDSTPFLAPLERDKRFTDLLSEDDRARQKSETPSVEG